MGLFKGLLKAGAVVGAAAGAVYAAERLALARLEGNPDPDPAWAPRTPHGRLTRVQAADGTALRAIVAGEGPPLLLLHGLMVKLEVWEPIFDDLVQAGHRVIAVDLRGHGGSTVGHHGHGVEPLAADVAAIIEQLDLHDAVAVGHSLGGMALLMFALRHPEVAADHLAGMILINSSAGGLFEVLQNKAQLALLKTGLALRVVASPLHGPLLATAYFAPRSPASRVKALSSMWAATPPDTVIEATTALVDYDVRHELADVAVATLVISGPEDRVTPPGHSMLLAEELPDARLESIPGGGHMLQWERPGELIDLITDFAKERQGTG